MFGGIRQGDQFSESRMPERKFTRRVTSSICIDRCVFVSWVVALTASRHVQIWCRTRRVVEIICFAKRLRRQKVLRPEPVVRGACAHRHIATPPLLVLKVCPAICVANFATQIAGQNCPRILRSKIRGQFCPTILDANFPTKSWDSSFRRGQFCPAILDSNFATNPRKKCIPVTPQPKTMPKWPKRVGQFCPGICVANFPRTGLSRPF